MKKFDEMQKEVETMYYEYLSTLKNVSADFEIGFLQGMYRIENRYFSNMLSLYELSQCSAWELKRIYELETKTDASSVHYTDYHSGRLQAYQLAVALIKK